MKPPPLPRALLPYSPHRQARIKQRARLAANQRYPPPTHNMRNPIFAGYPLFLNVPSQVQVFLYKGRTLPDRVFFLYLSYRCCIVREKKSQLEKTGRLGQVSRVCAHAQQALSCISQNELPALIIFLSRLIFAPS